MKESTVHSLVIARALLEQAEPLCNSDDRYLASSGLILLQDALEVVFYALLIELSVDESKHLEGKNFDELIGELKKAGIKVPKSTTIKALNKQRVLTKHYAQIADPVTVRGYYLAATIAINSTTECVLGKSINELFISDILANSDSKSCLKEAEQYILHDDFLNALISVRKAIYLEFEEDYNIYNWRNYDGKSPLNLLNYPLGGWKSPSWTKNKEWIDKNVHIPTDYIQIDRDELRLQAMEFGIHTMELENIQRLTPLVFRASRKDGWSVSYDANFPTNNANEKNARYCLDRAVSMILKKQAHIGTKREPTKELPFDPPAIYIGRIVYEKPSTESAQIHCISEGFTYMIRRVVGGFNPIENFYQISGFSEDKMEGTLLASPKDFLRGYLQILPDDI